MRYKVFEEFLLKVRIGKDDMIFWIGIVVLAPRIIKVIVLLFVLVIEDVPLLIFFLILILLLA